MNQQINITVHDLRGSGALATTVPTIAQLKQAQEQKKRQEDEEKQKRERERIMALTDEELANEIASNMPMAETIKQFRDSLKRTYPEGKFMLIGCNPVGDSVINHLCFEWAGKDIPDVAGALTEVMVCDSELRDMFNIAMQAMAQTTMKRERVEDTISMFEGLIETLKKRNTPEQRIFLLRNEAKRLTKAGKLKQAQAKRDEIAAIEREMAEEAEKARMEAELAQHKKEVHEKRLEYMAIAREALARKREQRRRQKNNPQPNFAKMAKQKRQQIAARQAEKKKKKACGGAEDVRSCSPMLKH